MCSLSFFERNSYIFVTSDKYSFQMHVKHSRLKLGHSPDTLNVYRISWLQERQASHLQRLLNVTFNPGMERDLQDKWGLSLRERSGDPASVRHSITVNQLKPEQLFKVSFKATLPFLCRPFSSVCTLTVFICVQYSLECYSLQEHYNALVYLP